MDFFGRSDYAHYIDFSLSSFESQHCLWVISLTYCLLGKKLWEPRFLEFFRRIAHQRRRTFLKKKHYLQLKEVKTLKLESQKGSSSIPLLWVHMHWKKHSKLSCEILCKLVIHPRILSKKLFFNESKNKIFILPYHSTYKQKDESKKVRKILCRPHYLADFK